MKDFTDRFQTNYKLTVIHKAVIAFLLVLGIFFLFNPEIYRLKVEYNPEEVQLSFLKAGDYEVQVTYNGASEGNFVVVSSDLATDSENHMGVEFARQEMEAASHGVIVLNFHLEQGTYGVRICPEQPEQCFEEVKIQRVQLLDRDHYFMFAICVVSALCIAFLGWYVSAEKYRDVLLLIGVGMAASIPMFSDFLPEGQDLPFHLARMEGLYQGLRSGDFPVRINPIQTELFGNLTATMYPQLFLYPAVLLRFFDVSIMLCYKILVVCMNVATAILTFYSVRGITNSKKTAYIAGVLYTFSLYRLTAVYFGATLGEALAMVFLPLLLWGIYEVLWGDKKKWYLLALGMTCIIQSHVLSVFMTVIFLVLEVFAWLAISVYRKISWTDLTGRIVAGIKAAVITCLINAGFLVPFLFFRGEKLLVYAWDYTLTYYELYFSQVFSLFPFATGQLVGMGTTKNEMPLSVGGILAVGAVLFIAAAYQEKKRSKTVSFGMHCLAGGGISLLLTSWLFPWNIMDEIDFLHDLTSPLQYSWRFLGIASLCLSVVSAIGVVMFVSGTKERNWVLGVYMAVALCSAWFFFDSMTLYGGSLSNEMDLEGNLSYDSLYMYDEREITDPVRFEYKVSENYIKTLHGTEVLCSDYRKSGINISSYVAPVGVVQEDEYLVFPLYYYPGYEILMDGRKVETVSQGCLVACRMPEEEAYVQVKYKGMVSWRIADMVSLITALGVGGYIVRQRAVIRKGRTDR